MKAEPLLPHLPQLLCQHQTQRACPQHRPCTPKGKGDRTHLFFQAPCGSHSHKPSPRCSPIFNTALMSWETSAAAALFPHYPRIEEHEPPSPELQLSAGLVTARPHAPHQPRQSWHTRASVWQVQMSPTFLRTQDDPALIPTSAELALFPAEDGDLGVPCLHVRSFSERPRTTCRICRPVHGQPWG